MSDVNEECAALLGRLAVRAETGRKLIDDFMTVAVSGNPEAIEEARKAIHDSVDGLLDLQIELGVRIRGMEGKK